MDLFIHQLQELGIATDNADIFKAFDEYMRMLIDWNKRINLTAITEPDEIISKHFTDSLMILKETDISLGASVLDIGTGAGFPGVPLKIVRGDIRLTLLDSINKRIIFLNELIKVLGLTEVITLHKRAEDIAHDAIFRENYDIVCARAVAKLSVLAEFCIPFVNIGGKFISMKGFDAKSEILESEKAILSMGGQIECVKQVSIPFTDIKRSIIIIRKTGQTSTRYPRKVSRILKNPII